MCADALPHTPLAGVIHFRFSAERLLATSLIRVTAITDASDSHHHTPNENVCHDHHVRGLLREGPRPRQGLRQGAYRRTSRRPASPGSPAFSASGGEKMPVRTPSLTLAPRPAPPRPQVAYGAPVKALKASAFAPKAARRSGVVAMSANTDEIIEKMKTLTVRLPMGFRFPAIGPAPLPRDPRRARIPEEARGSTRGTRVSSSRETRVLRRRTALDARAAPRPPTRSFRDDRRRRKTPTLKP